MSIAQLLTCRSCDYEWGPVGVQPYDPNAERHQFFLACARCREPQALIGAPGKLEFACRACGSTEYEQLSRCPGCGGPEIDWVPAFGGPPRPPRNTNRPAAAPQPAVAVAAQKAPAPAPAPRPVDDAVIETGLAGGYKTVMILAGLFSFFVATLAMWLSARSWPRRADGVGLTLRNGKLIRWEEFRHASRARMVNGAGATLNEWLHLEWAGGSCKLVPGSLSNGQQMLAAVLRRLPADVAKAVR